MAGCPASQETRERDGVPSECPARRSSEMEETGVNPYNMVGCPATTHLQQSVWCLVIVCVDSPIEPRAGPWAAVPAVYRKRAVQYPKGWRKGRGDLDLPITANVFQCNAEKGKPSATSCCVLVLDIPAGLALARC